MNINDKGLSLIKSFEGLRLTSYQDQGGVWTIGYGHTKNVQQDQTITEEQAGQFLLEDLADVESNLNSVMYEYSCTITSNQFSALCSFVYNVGIGNLKSSTLLKDLSAKYYDDAADQFLVWDHVNGQPNAGLLRRRQAERELFLED